MNKPARSPVKARRAQIACLLATATAAVLLLGAVLLPGRSSGPKPILQQLEEEVQSLERQGWQHLGYRVENSTHAAQQPRANTPPDDSIFVGVASFRDAVCHRTIADLFEKAERPERVFVGLLDQMDIMLPEEHCVLPQTDWAHSNVRVLQINKEQSRGPVTARYLTTMLYHDETFYLQVDSHMLFEPQWDTQVVEMWRERSRLLGSQTFILSHYPMSFEPDTWQIPAGSNTYIPAHCSGNFNSDGIFQPRDETLRKSQIRRTKPVPVAAAGMAFSLGSLIKEVPFDPFLPHLFHGEELLYSIRCYAAGWKIYTPDTNIVYHYYVRSGKPKSWEDFADIYYKTQQLSLMRVRRAMGQEAPASSDPPPVSYQLSRFSVSPEVFAEWQNEFGLDFAAQKVNMNYCH